MRSRSPLWAVMSWMQECTRSTCRFSCSTLGRSTNFTLFVCTLRMVDVTWHGGGWWGGGGGAVVVVEEGTAGHVAVTSMESQGRCRAGAGEKGIHGLGCHGAGGEEGRGGAGGAGRNTRTRGGGGRGMKGHHAPCARHGVRAHCPQKKERSLAGRGVRQSARKAWSGTRGPGTARRGRRGGRESQHGHTHKTSRLAPSPPSRHCNANRYALHDCVRGWVGARRDGGGRGWLGQGEAAPHNPPENTRGTEDSCCVPAGSDPR
jgi:hypothetical protein